MSFRRTPPTVITLAAGLLAAAALCPCAAGDDWPQWRGPDRNGISNETGWSAEGKTENAWVASVGLGYSSMAVSRGRLYTMGFDEEKQQDRVYCLDAATGREIWTHSYPAKIGNRMHGGGTLTTPSVDGDVVYTLNREGRFLCLGAADGKVIWSRNLMDEFELAYPTWGFSASPVVLEDMLILNVGRTIALQKKTGEMIWQTRNLGHAYSTPVDLQVDGQACLAVFNGGGLVLLDQATGEELTSYEWKTRYDVNAATPVIIDNKAFISSGYNRGCALIECAPGGMKVLWENKTMRNKMSGCVLWDGHLYGFDGAILKCIDLEGNEKWRQRGIGNGSLMAADGKLIIIGSKGELIIAEARPDAYKELSRRKCLRGGVYWTMPVLADGRIYCRSSEGSIVCRDHRPDPSTGGD